MHLRRSFATTVAAMLVAAPLLSSCGFNLNTDRRNTPSEGTYEQTKTVDVLSAVIVSSSEGQGTFIATMSNRQQTKPISFDSLSGSGGNTVVPGDVEEQTIPPRGFVNLADGGGVKITGAFGAGDVVPLSVGFDNGQSIEIDVPVVRACEEYADLDPAASESATPSATPTDAGETVEPGATASPSEAASESAAAESEDAEAYSCDFPRVGSTEDSGEGE